MRFGVHLPQYGHASGPEQIRRAAVQAEELGFSDVWVFDHLAVPAGQSYPVAYSYEPIVALTWAAAATNRVGIGTSVLVLPYRHPVFLAKALGSLDLLSGGRLVLGAAGGWLQAEFDALGVPFDQRGSLTEETIDFLRACWDGPQPVTFEGRHVTVRDMRILPQPGRRIPIWVGGSAPPALRRAAERGDGWHGAFVPPEGAAEAVERVRALRRAARGDDDSFTVSLRMEWDGLAMEADDLRRNVETLAAAGVDHVMSAPSQRDMDPWLRSVERLWETFSPFS